MFRKILNGPYSRTRAVLLRYCHKVWFKVWEFNKVSFSGCLNFNISWLGNLQRLFSTHRITVLAKAFCRLCLIFSKRLKGTPNAVSKFFEIFPITACVLDFLDSFFFHTIPQILVIADTWILVSLTVVLCCDSNFLSYSLKSTLRQQATVYVNFTFCVFLLSKITVMYCLLPNAWNHCFKFLVYVYSCLYPFIH